MISRSCFVRIFDLGKNSDKICNMFLEVYLHILVDTASWSMLELAFLCPHILLLLSFHLCIFLYLPSHLDRTLCHMVETGTVTSMDNSVWSSTLFLWRFHHGTLFPLPVHLRTYVISFLHHCHKIQNSLPNQTIHSRLGSLAYCMVLVRREK
jgi:hypothetical protein